MFEGRSYPVAQCNNSYIFPGLGLGVIASKANRVSDKMLMSASIALAKASPLAAQGEGPLLPPLSLLPEVSREIAFEVGCCAQEEGLAPPMSAEALRSSIQAHFWEASYRPFRRIPIPF
jgi:malate dehydrogenase (oxaloacetate-decarboxylating)